MKVLQVLPSLDAGGAEGFVTNLGVNQMKLGADVRFYLLAGARHGRGEALLARLRDADIEVIGAELRNIRSPVNLLRLVRLIRTWRPDIVQANLYSCEVACAAARALAVGSGALYVRRLANTRQCGSQSERIVRGLERFFQLTIACSPAVAEAYGDFMQRSLNDRLAIIANGGHLLDAPPTAQMKAEARQSLDIPQQAFVVGHIGRMFPIIPGSSELATEQKAHDVLLESFARGLGGEPDCVAILVGDGPLQPHLQALTEDLGVKEQVRFLGEQPEPWPALTAADVFFFPSRYEGLPNVLPEAASCGLPVVASDIAEIRYLDPGDGWLLEPADDVDRFAAALRRVRAAQSEFAAKAREAASGFRERFSMRACAEKYLRAYESVLGSNTTACDCTQPLD